MSNPMQLPIHSELKEFPLLRREPLKTGGRPVIFFDIDGTLLQTSSGRIAISRAFEEIFAIEEAFTDISFAGQTDPLIVERVFKENSIKTTVDNVENLYNLYYSHLHQEIENNVQPLPGIVSLLETLLQLPVQLGIITGNNYPGALIKLAAAGLTDYFEGGAYGEDGPLRSEIVGAALNKFAANPEKSFMIGDSIHDIRTGKEHGMTTIAVPTGVTPKKVLQAEDPDYLFDSLQKETILVLLDTHFEIN